MSGKALVLGGGGVAGIAWATGVVAALEDAGVRLLDADRVVGTSAGSAVAAQITSGLPMADLLARQTDPARQTPELPGGVDMAELWARLQAAYESSPDPAEQRRKVGELALSAATVSEAERRAVIEARLPVHAWPERDLVITAVDARTGEPRLFTRGSGVGLVDAVAASCAVPGVWPCVRIGGVPYMDGGVRSSTNADLAAGFDPVLVIAPMPDLGVPSWAALDGAVEVIGPDEAAQAAFGADPLAPESRTPSAEAGYAQGAAVAGKVAAFWK
ncbi:patatin-like phospholipase family protein [Actinomadura sp. ATCC 31491]|uniref:Patatin-like phospholipase family protein n=1 Tax=Actinomadura luzonensis TaxID=2805427 RepID=A0ABT0FP45_9ACTN|nr:patatin-like phospholipase family protein [Actinomadura luzonensis]MCK2214087.1 patatin-like phospholipase family protein [Actinomadura luzonensis]